MIFEEEIPKGRILHLQRLSTEDGPGIRTTVFFKGCPLHCAWCHNPESNTSYPQLQWLESLCIACETCLSACTEGTLARTEQGVVIDREECIVCGECVTACPSGALELLGSTVELESLEGELIKDRAYYETSGGGVTLSGGEPLMQPAFAAKLLQRLKTAGLQTAMDTCGLCNRNALETMLPWVDLILFDLKILDPQAHRRYTGQDNALILDNLLWLGNYIAKNHTPRLWIRTPLIPGATDSTENIAAIGHFLAAELGGLVERWELCAFNNLCREKYRRLGLDWAYADVPLLTRAELDALQDLARGCGLPAERVAVTGAARLELEGK